MASSEEGQSGGAGAAVGAAEAATAATVVASGEAKAESIEMLRAELRRADGSVITEMSVAEAMEVAAGLHYRGFSAAAEQLYRRLNQAEPGNVVILNLLAIVCFEQRNIEEAIAIMKHVLTLAPEYVAAHTNLGNMLCGIDRRDEGKAHYLRALELRPNDASTLSNLGNLCEDPKDAEALFRRALAAEPKHAPAWHNLGILLRHTGRPDEALECYRQELLIDPSAARTCRLVGALLASNNRLGEAAEVYRAFLAVYPDNPIIRHQLAAVTGEDVPGRASDQYVRGMFDSFASTFDNLLLEKLKYRAPTLVAAVVERLLGAPAATRSVLDAGAGTGLCGPLLKPYARHLVGVDLSARMLEKAQQRDCYDEIEVAELVAFMDAHPGAYDVIVSADTLVYFGDLTGAFAGAAKALVPGGILVFTVEATADSPSSASSGYRIEPHGRYSHAEAYVRASLEAAGLELVSLEPVHLRIEVGKPVDGHLVSARRR